MEEKGIQLRVYTPFGMVMEKETSSVILRTDEGDMGVLYNHEPYSALLDYGVLRYFQQGKEAGQLMVLGGFVTVMNNEVVVLSDMAERPEEIQAAIDRLAEERAANQIREMNSDLDIQRAEMVMRRSLVRMDVSSYAIIKGHEERDEDDDSGTQS